MRIIIGMVTGAVIVAAAIIGVKYFQQQNSEQGVHSNAGEAAFDEVSYFSKLRTQKPNSEGARVDIDSLIALLPASIVASYESIDDNAVNGATHLKGVVFAMADNEKVGVRIDDLYFWGVDANAIAARIKGENLDETIAIAKRIDAKGMKVFGLEVLYSSILDATQEKLLAAGSDTDDGEGSDFSESLATELSTSFAIDDYQFSIAQTIITDLVLHPYVLDLVSERFDAGELELNIGDDQEVKDVASDIIDIYQIMAAWTRAFSFEDYAMYDTKAAMSMTEKTLKASMDMDFGLMGYKGFDRGDYQHLIARDITYSMDMDIGAFAPNELSAASAGDELDPSFVFGGAIEAYRFQNVRLGKAMDHLARGVMPDTSLTDLMSLGLIEIDNQTYTMNGSEFYSVRKMIVDLSDFHWLIPNKINIELDDLVYDYVSYMEQLFTMFPTEENASSDIGAAFPKEQMEMFDRAFAILKENGFEKLTMDWDLSYNWDPQSGSFIGQHYFGLDDFMKFRLDVDLTMPKYSEIIAPIGDDIFKTDMPSYAKIFEDALYFNGVTMELADKGGVLKSFAIGADFAALIPDNPGLAFFRGADPQDLRVTSATMMRLAIGQIPNELAPLKVYGSAAADFVSKGGTLVLKAQPPTPISIAKMDELPGIDDPQKAIDLFGFTFERKNNDSIKDPHAN